MVTSQAEWLERGRPEHEREKPGAQWGRGGTSTSRARDNSGGSCPQRLRSLVFKCSDKLQQDVGFESNFSSRMCDFSTEVLGIVRGEKKGIHSDLVLLGIKLETQLRNKACTKFVFSVKNCPHK